MKAFQWILVAFLAVSVILDAFHIDPLGRFVTNSPPHALPAAIAISLLVVLVMRAHAAEERVAETIAHLERERLQIEGATRKLAETIATAEGLHQEVADLRRKIYANDIVLPGKLLLLQGRLTEAAAALRDALERHPESKDLHRLMGEALFRDNDAAGAMSHLQGACSEDSIDDLLLLARCERKLHRYGNAEARILRVMALRGARRPEDLAELGSVQCHLNSTKARATLEEALTSNPALSPARYALADLEIRERHYDRAVQLTTEGYERNDQDVGCLLRRARARLLRGDRADEDAVLNDVNVARRKNSRDMYSYQIAAELHSRRALRATNELEAKQEVEKAIAVLEDGLASVSGGFRAPLFQLKSQLLVRNGDVESATAAAKQAIAAREHPHNRLALVMAHLAAKRWAPAAAAVGSLPEGRPGPLYILLSAGALLGYSLAGGEPADLTGHILTFASAASDGALAELPVSWPMARRILLEAAAGANGRGRLVEDVIKVVEGDMPSGEFRGKWTQPNGGRPPGGTT